MKVYGQLEYAQLHVSASALSPLSTGLFYYDSVLGYARLYNASVWVQATLPDQTGHNGKALFSDGTSAAWQATASSPTLTDQLPQVGSIVAYHPGYFTGVGNTGFTLVGPATNTVAGVNAFLPANWRVCDGTALNDAGSTIFNGAGRYLPDLTDARFLMGSTATGSTGGSSTNSHTHSVTSNVAVNQQPAFTVPSHAHNMEHTHQWAYYQDSTLGFFADTSSDKTSSSIGSGHIDVLVGSTVAAGGGGLHTDATTNGTTIQGGGNRNLYTTGVADGINGSGSGASTQATALTLTRSADVTLTNNAVTSGAPSDTENRPKYLAAFYIMRVK